MHYWFLIKTIIIIIIIIITIVMRNVNCCLTKLIIGGVELL